MAPAVGGGVIEGEDAAREVGVGEEEEGRGGRRGMEEGEEGGGEEEGVEALAGGTEGEEGAEREEGQDAVQELVREMPPDRRIHLILPRRSGSRRRRWGWRFPSSHQRRLFFSLSSRHPILDSSLFPSPSPSDTERTFRAGIKWRKTSTHASSSGVVGLARWVLGLSSGGKGSTTER